MEEKPFEKIYSIQYTSLFNFENHLNRKLYVWYILLEALYGYITGVAEIFSGFTAYRAGLPVRVQV